MFWKIWALLKKKVAVTKSYTTLPCINKAEIWHHFGLVVHLSADIYYSRVIYEGLIVPFQQLE